MAKKRTRFLRVFFLLLSAAVCVSLMLGSIAMLAQYSDNIRSHARLIGLQRTDDVSDRVRSAIYEYEEKAAHMGSALLSIPVEDAEDFNVQMQRLRLDERFSDVMFTRYFKDGVEYDAMGEVFDQIYEDDTVIQLANLKRISCAGVVTDRQFSISAAAFVVPMINCPYADTLVVFYPTSSVVSYSDAMSEYDLTVPRLSAICSNEGEVVAILANNDTDISLHNNIYEFFEGKINDKSTLDAMRAQLFSGKSDSENVSISGEDHIISVSTIKEYGPSFFAVVELYRSESLYGDGYRTVRTVLSSLVIFTVIITATLVVYIVLRRIREKRESDSEGLDPLTGCYTREKFQQIADQLITKNRSSNYAVAVTDIKHYDYLTTQISPDMLKKLLLHMKLLFSRMMEVDESFGYLENGKFVLLLHYKDKEKLEQRLDAVISLAASQSPQFTEKYTLTYYGGVCIADKSKQDKASKLIDLAVTAKEATKYPYDFGSFRYYNELFHSSDVQAEYIEMNMESALKNNDFRVFYQPKCNLSTDRPDGCEALVRWYNPELDDYMRPDVFVPLFEANGFIVKLDEYVYEQVCKYIVDAVENELPLYPISVNVSHITAKDPGFIDFFVQTKKKYNISDGFITVEFSEKFAYEDYDILRDTIATLHKNGFKCAIDNFGTGLSSYNVLKELPVDEAKLDRMFMKKGFDTERDMKVLASVISICRDLNMKVTQQGVETGDQAAMLKKLGCSALQGYHYSKPLSLTDYTAFLSGK